MSGLRGEGRRWCGVVVALALLFHALLPLLHQSPVSAEAAGLPAWIMSSLCRGASSADEATIPADQGDTQPSSPRMPTCPICLAAQLAALQFSPPLPTELPLPPQVESNCFYAVAAAPTIAARIISPQARAPPPVV